jgi:transposase
MGRVVTTEWLRRLLAVKGLTVCGAGFEPRGFVVDVKPCWRKGRCGLCGRPSPGYDQQKSRYWRHLAMGRTPFWLRYAPRRVTCREHGQVVEKVPWAAHDAYFTRDFDQMVAWLAQRMDKSAVCRLMTINWRTVGTVITRVVQERLNPCRLEHLSIIGVDELAYRQNHRYLTVVVDHINSRVVWMGEGKGEETLKGFFDELRPERTSKLSHVTMDLSAPYNNVVTERAPQAEKVFDRFHIQKLANEAVDTIRRDEMHKVVGTEQAAAIKRSRWALLKSPWNLTVSQGGKLHEVQRSNRRLYRAYLLKESLARGMDYRQCKRAAEHFKGWRQWASHSKLKPFVRLSGTIRRHIEGILAYVKTRLNNGLAEGINNKIRLIIRRAYGFRSVEALKSMILLCCGGIELNPPLPIVLQAL